MALVLAFSLGVTSFAHGQGAPANWQYAWNNNVATATYPGDVVVNGKTTTTGPVNVSTIVATTSVTAPTIAATTTATTPLITSTTSVNSGVSYVGQFNPSNVAANWMETLRPNSSTISQSVNVSATGKIGLLAGSQSSLYACTACMGSIGIESIAWNDNTTNVQYGFAGYFENTRQSGAGTSHGIEIDMRNRGTVVNTNPYLMTPAGSTQTLWLAGGAGEVSNDVSHALGIIANGSVFGKGISFGDGSLRQDIDTLYRAVNLPQGYALTWWKSGSALLGNIYGRSSGAGNGTYMHLKFDDNLVDGTGGIVFENNSGAQLFSITQVGPILQGYAVASLPTCNAARAGALAFATNLTAVTYNAAPTGGGALKSMVLCNGTGWTIH